MRQQALFEEAMVPLPLFQLSEYNKELITRELNQKYGIDVIAADGEYFVNLMAVSRRMVKHFIMLIELVPGGIVRFSEDHAYLALVVAGMKFFKKYGRSTVAVRDYLTDLPQILHESQLSAKLH